MVWLGTGEPSLVLQIAEGVPQEEEESGKAELFQRFITEILSSTNLQVSSATTLDMVEHILGNHDDAESPIHSPSYLFNEKQTMARIRRVMRTEIARTEAAVRAGLRMSLVDGVEEWLKGGEQDSTKAITHPTIEIHKAQSPSHGEGDVVDEWVTENHHGDKGVTKAIT